MGLKDLFRAEITLKRSSEDVDGTYVRVFNVDDIKRYYSHYESQKAQSDAVSSGDTVATIYYLNSDRSYDGIDTYETVVEIQEKISKAETERLERIKKARVPADLCDLFRAEVSLRRSGDDGSDTYVQVFNVNDIKRYQSHYETKEDLASAIKRGDTVSTVYYELDECCYDSSDFLDTVEEIQKKIRQAEDERVERIRQYKLGIV